MIRNVPLAEKFKIRRGVQLFDVYRAAVEIASLCQDLRHMRVTVEIDYGSDIYGDRFGFGMQSQFGGSNELFGFGCQTMDHILKLTRKMSAVGNTVLAFQFPVPEQDHQAKINDCLRDHR
jgi:hypothetical protein